MTTQLALVSLDCVTGDVRRYTRGGGEKMCPAGTARFDTWPQIRYDEATVYAALQSFRLGYLPEWHPEPDPPVAAGFASA